MAEQKTLMVLISSGLVDRTQASNQARALAMLDARKVPYGTLDGMDPEQREQRNELFGISGVRGRYPQFFFIKRDGSATYFGDWEKLEVVNEADGLPEEVLAQNPQIETWDKTFGNVVAEFQ